MGKPNFRLVAASYGVPYGAVNLALSGLDEVGQLFDIPIKVSKIVPEGEVWVFCPADADDDPSAKLSNITIIQDSISMEASVKHPLKTMSITLTPTKKEDE